MQNWSGAILPAGPWPQKRSFHSACSLPDPNFLSNSHHRHHPCSARKSHPWLPCFTPDLSVAEDRRLGLDPKLLVLWGMDNDAEPVNDAWILNVTTLTWEKVRDIEYCMLLPPQECGDFPRVGYFQGFKYSMMVQCHTLYHYYSC